MKIPLSTFNTRLRFFIFDPLTLLPVLAFVFHPRSYTFYFAVGTIVIFNIVERLGYRMPELLRKVRFVLSGERLRVRSPYQLSLHRRLIKRWERWP